jgi:hypothetical protein
MSLVIDCYGTTVLSDVLLMTNRSSSVAEGLQTLLMLPARSEKVSNGWPMCVQDRRAELLILWGPALSAESAAALDIKKYLTSSLVSAPATQCAFSPYKSRTGQWTVKLMRASFLTARHIGAYHFEVCG